MPLKRLLVLGLVAAAVLAALWFLPSNHYLFLPTPADPVDPLVRIPNEKPGTDPGGIYLVAAHVGRASLFERLFPWIYDGATLVSEHAVNPIGVSEQQRRQSSLNEMSRSQEIAVAVALEELGHEVPTRAIGAEVVLIQPDSPAEGKLAPGDVIVAAKGTSVTAPDELIAAMRDHRPGEPVEVAFLRDGRRRSVEVDTQPHPENPRRAVVGVIIQQAAEITLPVKVRIQAGDIGGPSAGLAFALDVFDELGRDLDHGRRIAVTGEIDLDGDVGAVGGLKQKTIGARLAGATVFVVPRGNVAEAKRYADGLRVVGVSTFKEAVRALGPGA